MESEQGPGPIALVGSGEYSWAMEDTDRALLEAVGGAARARVVVLPTASGLEEPGSPAKWIRMGLEHFTRLGAHVDAAPILTPQDAHDPQWLALLERADFYYYSGGNPQHLIEAMQGSPAWEAIRRRTEDGAALAGCSAGAMAICGRTSRLRALRDEGRPDWMEALGVLPRLIVMPHFDRMAGFIGQEVLARVVSAVPAGMTLLGVDEDTALVCLQRSATADVPTTWQVLGSRAVSVFSPENGATPTVYRTGASLTLQAT